MIWVDGRIIADEALAIPALDRTFEHGLGLFETFRTWGGRPTLLERHKARMIISAEELGIPIDPASLPDADDVRSLLEAERIEGDRMFRITATGGTASGNSVVWMRSAALPPIKENGAIVCVDAWNFSLLPPGEGARELSPLTGSELVHPPIDFTARHKTLNYWFKRVAFEQARALDYDETLIRVEPWGLAEASRSNLFLVIGDALITVSTQAPIVPGIMRGLILDVAAESRFTVREVQGIEPDQLRSATEIFLTNAVRGIVPVASVDTAFESLDWTSPGPWTAKLQELIARRLWPDRGESP